MAHVEKYTRTATGALCAHFERAKDSEGKYTCFRNQDIDPERTNLNYNLAPVHEEGQVGFIRKRLSEVQCMNRTNVNVMCAWVLTLPKEFEQERDFFEGAYRFMADRYGEENVISAYVHKDEKQPHMHFSFIPVRNGKVSAKEIITLMELKRFHPELKAYLENLLGREVPVLNGATAGGNRTVAEMKAERDTERAQEVSRKAEILIKETEAEIQAILNEKSSLQQELKELRGRILSKKEITELQGQKTVSGNLKGITYDEYIALSQTAQYVQELEVDVQEAKELIKILEQQVKDKEEEIKKAQEERPTTKLIKENATLKSFIANTETRLRRLAEILPEKAGRAIMNILNDRDPFYNPIHYSRGLDVQK